MPLIPPETMFEGSNFLNIPRSIESASEPNNAHPILYYWSASYSTVSPWDTVEYEGIDEINTFDRDLSEKALRVAADRNISTNVVEHYFHAPSPSIIEETFSLAGKYVGCNADCFSVSEL